jgi:hypothetical protein
MSRHYYYLHTNGDLIGKPPIVVDSDPSYFDSPFVKKVWEIDTEERMTCWTLILEALASGARVGRVRELTKKWNCDKADSVEAILRIKPNDLMKKGIRIFIKEILGMDVEKYWKEIEAMGDKQDDN